MRRFVKLPPPPSLIPINNSSLSAFTSLLCHDFECLWLVFFYLLLRYCFFVFVAFALLRKLNALCLPAFSSIVVAAAVVALAVAAAAPAGAGAAAIARYFAFVR